MVVYQKLIDRLYYNRGDSCGISWKIRRGRDIRCFFNSNEVKTLLILVREGIGKTSLIINSIKNRNDCYYTKYIKNEFEFSVI